MALAHGPFRGAGDRRGTDSGRWAQPQLCFAAHHRPAPRSPYRRAHPADRHGGYPHEHIPPYNHRHLTGVPVRSRRPRRGWVRCRQNSDPTLARGRCHTPALTTAQNTPELHHISVKNTHAPPPATGTGGTVTVRPTATGGQALPSRAGRAETPMPGAAEPAGNTPTQAVGGDTVIHLDGRRGPRTGDRSNGKGRTVGARGEPADTPEAILAQTIQALYLHQGRTLTDPDTAAAFDIAITAAKLIVDGAQARGGLSGGDHETLQRMLDTARRVPHVL